MFDRLRAFQASLRGQTMKRWDYLRAAATFLNLEVRSIAEVGVYDGTMAAELRELFPEADLYLIDPWQQTENYNRSSAGNRFRRDGIRTQSGYDRVYEHVRDRFAWDKRVHLLRMSSREAVERIPMVDLTFIDANHSYDAVAEDIRLWRNRTRLLLSGHDFHGFPGVHWAVSESTNAVASGKNKGDVWLSPPGPWPNLRTLIVYVAFGSEYLHLAQRSYRSLIRHHSASTVLLVGNSERPEWLRPNDLFLDLRRYPQRHHFINTPQRKLFRNTTNDHLIDYLKVRTSIDLLQDLSAYDYVLYLDCDTLVAGNLEPLFHLDSRKILGLGQRHRSLAAACGDFLAGQLNSNSLDMARRRIKSNAGIVGVPRSLVAEFFPRWRALYEQFVGRGILVERGKDLSEENTLNYLFCTSSLERIFDDRIGYKTFRPGKLLYHFIGGHRIAEVQMNAMERCIREQRRAAGDSSSSEAWSIP